MGEDGKVDIALIIVGIIELAELLKKYSSCEMSDEFEELVSICERIVVNYPPPIEAGACRNASSVD